MQWKYSYSKQDVLQEAARLFIVKILANIITGVIGWVQVSFCNLSCACCHMTISTFDPIV